MSLQRAKSIFFLHDVRMGRPVSGVGATRISLVEDKRYHAFVDPGLGVEIRDTLQGVTIHVPWHCVRDYELAGDEKPKAAEKAPQKVA